MVDTITIIGVGLIGGSIGMAAKAKGLARRVVGVSRRTETLQRARELAAIDTGTKDLRSGVAEADLVFVCTPVLSIVPVIQAIAGSLKEGAIVTDVGSTKAQITRDAEAALPEGRYFVGGHPMAGLETAGVDSALPYLFLDTTYAVTPVPSTDLKALQTVVGFAEGLGAQVILMSPEQHDSSAAVISHLPHVLSAAILRLAAEEQNRSGKVFELAAGSFRDMTRVALSPPEIWRDICMSSTEALTSVIKRFEEMLAGIREDIASGDSEAVCRLFSEGREIRETQIKAGASFANGGSVNNRAS
ncbi:MAG: prephenate dehydrogenase [Armatimonadetes bacterium]|nr:prephenate dehydrogenase [Armatimonadota bacterium]